MKLPLLYSRFASYYERFEEPKRDVMLEALLVNKIMRQFKARRLLDVGCGSGVHYSILFPSFEIVGVDLSMHMLRVAQEKSPTGLFVQADMRALPFKDEAFDGAYSLYGSVNYLISKKDMMDFLTGLARVLKKGAPFIMDVWHALPFMLFPNVENKRDTEVHLPEVSIVRFISYTVMEDSTILVRHRYEIEGGHGKEVIHDEHRNRLFFRKEVEDFLQKAGFTPEQIWADPGMHPFSEESVRMVVLAVKR